MNLQPIDSTMKPGILSLVLTLALASRVASAEAVSLFELLGDLPGGSDYSEALGVSVDGTYVVGESSSAASGPYDRLTSGNPTEAFLWDSNSKVILGLGDLPGGRFSSRAVAVSANGNFVAGSSEETSTAAFDPIRTVPFHWSRGGSPAMRPLMNTAQFPGFLFKEPARQCFATVTGMSDDGRTVIGTSSWIDASNFDVFSRAFYATPGRLNLTFFDLLPTQSASGAITHDGAFVVGSDSAIQAPESAFLVALRDGIVAGPKEGLGQISGVSTRPTGISMSGRTFVGEFLPLGEPTGTFVCNITNGLPVYKALRRENTRAVGISGNGRVILDSAGGLYLDELGPFDLQQILVEDGAADLEGLPPASFRVHAISRSGFVVVGGVDLNGVTRAWKAILPDSDANDVPDALELRVCQSGVRNEIARGSQKFAETRELLGYGDMVSLYGRPWRPGTDRTPARDGTDPAEVLRASLGIETGGCFDEVPSVVAADKFLQSIGFPVVNELHSFEMLLGNEAYADAQDATIGMDGIPAESLGDEFAFRGTPGIHDLLDEELALLRGRDLPGTPQDWLGETIYYPEIIGPGDAKRRVAVYNRLPPNASSSSGVAYRSNYRVADNYEAAGKFPQGHGDAYGYYLTALKTGLDFLREGPANWPAEHLSRLGAILLDTTVGQELIRHLAESSAARARTALQVVDLLHRRDYHEGTSSPGTSDLFFDADPARAWSMGDWARRGALGAFLDWASVSHLAPEDPESEVERSKLLELDELASAAGGFQQKLDTAGAGLDPLGLLQNVVPFGIDASGLQPGSGRSHYEQVRDAASRALENSRKAFEVANQAGQRLRDSDKALEDFRDRLEDTRADHDQRLIEIFGLPSQDDPLDNDLDPSTNDLVEAQSHPDLTTFLSTDEVLGARGMRPRPAPGQVQIALSELRVAALRVEQAENAVDELSAQIQSQFERIQLLVQVQRERVKIVTKAGDDQMALTDRLAQISARKKTAGFIGSFTTALAGAAAGNPSGLLDFVGQVVTEVADQALTAAEGETLNTEFDIERERTRVQTWKELELQGLEDKLTVDRETRELKALLRRSPSVLVDLTIAQELASQALGRLKQSVERGREILREKNRLESRVEGNLLEERWKDMSFRVFRNAALKSYRALFDIAGRYVILAARAYAYEFDARSDGADVLAGIYQERRLGSTTGLQGGLQGVLNRIDGAVTVNNFNRPLETLGERTFSLRRNLLGIGADDFPNDDLRFRAFLETQIVEHVEDLSEITELAQLSIDRDYGPALVITFGTEIDSRNFFGRGPELPFGNSNFSLTRNAKIRSYAIRLDGVDASLGTDPESGTVFAYLLPAGDSVLRENTNQPRIEDELITPWAVVDQFLPVPPLAPATELSKRSFNPWRSTAQVSGNYLNEVKRHRDSEAQIELGQSESETRYNTNLAGRSAWNTRWLLVIPGSQWTSSSDPVEIRNKLLQMIYGADADPAEHVGITDIRLIIQAYSH